MLLANLLHLYSEIITRSIQDMHGVSVSGRNLNNLRCADDTVLIAASEMQLQAVIVVFQSESPNVDLIWMAERHK